MTNNDNTLVLFVNEYKTTDNHPDFKGKATVDGKEYKCAAWKKAGKNTGAVYISVKLTPELEMTAATPAPKAPIKKREEDNEIPF